MIAVIPRVSKFVETENTIKVSRRWRKELLFTGYRVFIVDDEKVWGSYTTL